MKLYQLIKKLRKCYIAKDLRDRDENITLSFVGSMLDYISHYSNLIEEGFIDTPIDKVSIQLHRGEIDVYAIEFDDDTKQDISFKDWEYLLAAEADIPEKFSKREYVANVLWEMTWNGLPHDMKARRRKFRQELSQ